MPPNELCRVINGSRSCVWFNLIYYCFASRKSTRVKQTEKGREREREKTIEKQNVIRTKHVNKSDCAVGETHRVWSGYANPRADQSNVSAVSKRRSERERETGENLERKLVIRGVNLWFIGFVWFFFSIKLSSVILRHAQMKRSINVKWMRANQFTTQTHRLNKSQKQRTIETRGKQHSHTHTSARASVYRAQNIKRVENESVQAEFQFETN